MFAIICRRSVRVRRNDCITQFLAPQNAILATSFSSEVSSSDSDQSFTVSYLVNSCRLSSNDAVSVSKKLCIKSRENADAVLDLLRNYGFTNAHIAKLVTRSPLVLHSCPNKTLSPKLEFFRSIGVTDAVLAKTLSLHPSVFGRSLERHLLPSFNYLRSILQSDKEVIKVFSRVINVFARGSGCQRVISANIATLRERGVSQSSIAALLSRLPLVLMLREQTFTACVDRAVEIGFDKSKIKFVRALEVFGEMSESTLKHKMDVYRSCGMSDSEITTILLKQPHCMKLSEKKIRANMEFLMNEAGLKASEVAQCPVVLSLDLEIRMRPRWNVSRVLEAKGVMKKAAALTTLLKMTEEAFVKRYIVDHQKDIPELLDVYRGS